MKNGGGGAPENKLLRGKFLGFTLELLRFKKRILPYHPESGARRIYKNGVQEILRFAQNDKKCAFTLAEVLITLGVIGIVAAMTFPMLMKSYRKQIIETRLSTFYSKINEAIRLSEVVNGDKKYWEVIPNAGYETDEDNNTDYSKPLSLKWFNRYLRPYIKILKVEADQKSGFTVVYFIDGSCARLAGQGIQFYPNAKDYPGYKINTDSGIKYFTFYFSPTPDNVASGWEESSNYHYDKGIEPYMWQWDGNIDSLINNATFGCNPQNTGERAYCAQLIRANGWKIPKNYPLHY